MYFKLSNKVLFRQYNNYGHLTDNSMFGYHYLNDNDSFVGEKYVSMSGAIFLSALTKEPLNIDSIINKILLTYTDANRTIIKKDAINFYLQLAKEGFVCFGNTTEKCNDSDNKLIDRTISNLPKDIVQKDIIPLEVNDLLSSIHIEIVNECNERCVHCYIPHDYKNKILDTDIILKILKEGRDLNIINVTLTGGEPLLHKDFLQIIKKCHELDLSVNILSNLTLLTDNMIMEMKKNPLLSVQTSLYSMTPEIHDGITCLKGSFNKTTKAIGKLIDAGIPIQISCPIMKQNKTTFCDVINWGKEHNISVLVDYMLFAAYDHSNFNLCNRLSIQDIKDVIDKQITIDKHFIANCRQKAKEKSLQSCDDPICSVCKYYYCISAEGDVFPCAGWQQKKLGNIIDSSIEKIINTSEQIKFLKQIKRKDFTQCMDCDDKDYCTICMMKNANENNDGDIFKVNKFNCQVAKIIHSKIEINSGES